MGVPFIKRFFKNLVPLFHLVPPFVPPLHRAAGRSRRVRARGKNRLKTPLFRLKMLLKKLACSTVPPILIFREMGPFL